MDPKNISLNNVTEEEDSIKISFNELNFLKNKNTNNYFTSNILVKTKTNNSKCLKGPNSTFNVYIDRNKIK